MALCGGGGWLHGGLLGKRWVDEKAATYSDPSRRANRVTFGAGILGLGALGCGGSWDGWRGGSGSKGWSPELRATTRPTAVGAPGGYSRHEAIPTPPTAVGTRYPAWALAHTCRSCVWWGYGAIGLMNTVGLVLPGGPWFATMLPTIEHAGVTQLVEYLLPKQALVGSSPIARSKFC